MRHQLGTQLNPFREVQAVETHETTWSGAIRIGRKKAHPKVTVKESAMRDSSSVAKTIQSLARRVEAGDYYEAQQTYKARYARFVGSLKYDDAVELLQSGACVQLKHGQVTCGTELGVLLIETFRKAQLPFGPIPLDRIIAIYKEFPRVDISKIKVAAGGGTLSEDCVAARTRVEGCTTFLKAAMKWSIDSGGPDRGAPVLHHMLANYIWTQSPIPEFGKASLYYIRGDCPEAFSQAVVDCMGKCYPEEVDLVVARAILQYLTLGYVKDANVLLEKIKEATPEKLPASPLLHFIKFLLQTVERDAFPLFQMLRQSYKPSIDRDPTFDEYLDEIAEQFYNVRQNSGIQGMLGDIMKMFGDV